MHHPNTPTHPSAEHAAEEMIALREGRAEALPEDEAFSLPPTANHPERPLDMVPAEPIAQQLASTLRRCIGALMACEDRFREDVANLEALEGDAAGGIDHDLRTALANLCALTITEARATSERLQAAALQIQAGGPSA